MKKRTHDQAHQATTGMLLLPAVALLAGCGSSGGGGPSTDLSGRAASTIVSAQAIIAPGPTCSNGGVQVDSGIDENSNGVLDADEVDTSEVVCHGEDGFDSLIAITAAGASVDCPNGGLRIDTGLDVDRNGVLDAGEVTQTELMCNGNGAAGWLGAELVHTSHGIDFPRVAVDANGDAVAVWRGFDGARYSIWASRHIAGAGWSAAENITADLGHDADYPEVAMDGSGNAVAVWQQDGGARMNIWANRYTPGSGWGTAELIETDDTGNAVRPRVVMDSAGNAVAVWAQFDGTRNNIRANRYTAGAGWGTSGPVGDDTGDASVPHVAIDAGGQAVAVWRQSDGVRYNVWANRHYPGSGWGTAELIETDDAGDPGAPQVATNAAGDAVAVWMQFDGVQWNAWANRYAPGAGWEGAALIETGAEDAMGPQVALDVAGNAVAVWFQSDGTRNHIWANRYVAGAGWGTAELIETHPGNATNPQIAVDASGAATVVWEQSAETGAPYAVWMNRYVAGAAWGIARPIGSGQGHAYPRVAADGAGNVLTMWVQSEGSGAATLWSNRYVAP